jgi:hypothetical protein
MTNTRTFKLWIVNVASFILFSMLGLTGLINWLVLPRWKYLIMRRRLRLDFDETVSSLTWVWLMVS